MEKLRWCFVAVDVDNLQHVFIVYIIPVIKEIMKIDLQHKMYGGKSHSMSTRTKASLGVHLNKKNSKIKIKKKSPKMELNVVLPATKIQSTSYPGDKKYPYYQGQTVADFIYHRQNLLQCKSLDCTCMHDALMDLH